MSKNLRLVLALAALCALSLFLLDCGSSSSRPSGVLYVLTEGSSGIGNNVTSFALDLNSGGLSLVNSNASTCTASGVSCGPPLSIVLDPTGATAFVLNQGVPSGSAPATIYSYNVNSDGSLGTPNQAASLPVGDLPIAMVRDAAGQYLFVLDEGTDPSSANCSVPNTQCASIVVFSATPGQTSLTQVAGSPFPINRIPSALSVVSFAPPSGAQLPCAGTSTTDFLFVTYISDPVHQNDNTLSAYCVDSTGTPNDLTPNFPYATSTDPLSVQAVNTTPAGQTGTGGIFVYIGSQPTSAGALSIFQMCTASTQPHCTSTDVANATLVPVTGQTTPTPGIRPISMVVDPTNQFLYVLCQGQSAVYGYRIGTTSGYLTSQAPAYEPTGSMPVSMALHPSVGNTGQYLYVSNSLSGTITGFALSTTTGSMTSLGSGTTSPSTPSGMAVR